jgi:CubicO group peptidase (beta-lactamase class C family)
MAAMLYERGLLELDAPVAGVVPEFLTDNSDARRSEISFRMLLAHSSGLPAYEKLFLIARSGDELLARAFTMPLKYDPGTHAEYSDIGFIILGVALERLAGETIDKFCQQEIFGRLTMPSATFNPPAPVHAKVPPTADEREEECGAGAPARELPPKKLHRGPTPVGSAFRQRIVQGEVQDENAFVLGGVAGHAGLFSTAEDVAHFAQAMLQSGAGAPARELHAENAPPIPSLLRPETVALFTRRQSAPPSTSHALGWDTPSQPSQSGKYFGPHSFGHLGYTGTSLWIDPDRQLSITLLTNRTWPDCQNQRIKQVRPQFHDAVIQTLKSVK